MGDYEEMYVAENPMHADDRIFSELVGPHAAGLDEGQRGSIPQWILLVEDNPPDVILIREALREYAPTDAVTVATDGDQALRHFQPRGPRVELPDLVLLDLSLPKLAAMRYWNLWLVRTNRGDFCSGSLPSE